MAKYVNNYKVLSYYSQLLIMKILFQAHFISLNMVNQFCNSLSFRHMLVKTINGIVQIK